MSLSERIEKWLFSKIAEFFHAPVVSYRSCPNCSESMRVESRGSFDQFQYEKCSHCGYSSEKEK